MTREIICVNPTDKSDNILEFECDSEAIHTENPYHHQQKIPTKKMNNNKKAEQNKYKAPKPQNITKKNFNKLKHINSVNG